MQKIIIPILSISLLSSIIYANSIETNPEAIIEKENREAILECLENVYAQTGTTDMIRQIKECESIPLRSITGTVQLTPASEPPSIETVKLNDCMSKYNHKKVCTEYAQGLRTSNIKFEIETEELGKLHEKVCQKQINSPLCKDRALFDRLYQLTEERLPNKQFFPILLGILNSESSLGTNFYPSGCSYTNNLAGKKWKKTDDGKSVRDQKIPDKNGCWLYSFESIEDFWISYTNTFRYGYPGCIDSKTPLSCIAPMYVKGDGKPKPQWVKNASVFLE